MSQDNSNKDAKSTNVINIEENLLSHDFTQMINLNENILMAERANENSSSGNNKQSTDQMINTTDTTLLERVQMRFFAPINYSTT